MKILFLTSEGFDTPNSTNHLAETLLEDLLKKGIEVHSITSHKTGTYADIPESLLKCVDFGFTYDIINRDNIDKNNFVKRYLDEVKYAFNARKIWKKHKGEYDAVLMQSNPNSVINAVLLSSLKNRSCLICTMFSLDTLCLSELSKISLFIMFSASCKRFCIRSADI